VGHTCFRAVCGRRVGNIPTDHQRAGVEPVEPSATQPIPEPEESVLLLCVQDAVNLAVAGDPPAGYRSLAEGLERARESLDDGQPWAEALLQRYLDALEEYAARWGLELE
jgi:hypothetical protein